MGDIIVRKDHTSICCSQKEVHGSEKKLKHMELAVALILMVAGTSIMLLVH